MVYTLLALLQYLTKLVLPAGYRQFRILRVDFQQKRWRKPGRARRFGHHRTWEVGRG